jgi:hypothetical protein
MGTLTGRRSITCDVRNVNEVQVGQLGLGRCGGGIVSFVWADRDAAFLMGPHMEVTDLKGDLTRNRTRANRAAQTISMQLLSLTMLIIICNLFNSRICNF